MSLIPSRVKASEGYVFKIGLSQFYVGPSHPSIESARRARMLPVLAVERPEDRGRPRILIHFPNSTAAESYIEAMKLALDEATGGKAAPVFPSVALVDAAEVTE